jgi:GDPmannose 4,6-dehydratase
MPKTAFITGIAGQDGSYLSEYLKDLGYRVTGIVRRNSVAEHQKDRLSDSLDIEFKYGDVLDPASLNNAIEYFQPDEIYNLAAQSHVRISSDIPVFTVSTNALGVLNMLESFRLFSKHAKFYQASSSEMFGSSVDSDGYQRETTPMNPVSPYGCAKVFGYHIGRHYREAYGLYVANGILFNHESPRRGSNFVTNKVVKTAVQIKLGQESKLRMGNLDSFRDWGHSADYVRAMHSIINAELPSDYVVATGTTHSVRELCEYVFAQLDLDYNDYVIQDAKFLRPQELKYLRGDATRIKTELGWAPTYTFETLLDEMIQHWQKILS